SAPPRRRRAAQSAFVARSGGSGAARHSGNPGSSCSPFRLGVLSRRLGTHLRKRSSQRFRFGRARIDGIGIGRECSRRNARSGGHRQRRAPMRRLAPLAVVLALGLSPDTPPTPSPTPPPQQPPTMLDLRMLRFKISAGDLYSAESILEWHKAEKGEDAEYVLGMAWLARGAALLGDWNAAGRYAKAARELAGAKPKSPAGHEQNPEAVYALGAAIEVEAQALVTAGRTADAIRLLEDSSRVQERAPYNLRARIWKRRNQIELVGKTAPAIRAEDHVGADF